MWALDHKEGWVLKNWCFWTVVLEKTLESPLYCKEITPGNPKGNQSWIFIGRPDAEVETPILWLPDVKSWLIEKDPDAGKDWSQEEKGITEDEMVGLHHWFGGHKFEQAPEVGDGQGGLMCCSPWVWKELDMTGRLKNNSNHYVIHKSFSIHKWNTIDTLLIPKNYSRDLGHIDQNSIHSWSEKPVMRNEYYENSSPKWQVNIFHL